MGRIPGKRTLRTHHHSHDTHHHYAAPGRNSPAVVRMGRCMAVLSGTAAARKGHGMAVRTSTAEDRAAETGRIRYRSLGAGRMRVQLRIAHRMPRIPVGLLMRWPDTLKRGSRRVAASCNPLRKGRVVLDCRYREAHMDR
eukprot:766979-Pyramimonas_sp.AAC.1